MEIDYVEAFLLEDKQNELNIATKDKVMETYRVYWTYEKNVCTKEKEFLFESNQKNIRFAFEYNPKQVNYFIIEFTTHPPLLFGYRILPIAGMYNFRDIGGYRTANGQRIKWGIGYRSDHLKNMKEEGFDYLASLKLKAVIDFRSPTEVQKDPNPFFSESVHTFNYDPKAQTAIAAGSAQSLDTGKAMKLLAAKAIKSGKTGEQEMIDQQLAFVDQPASIQAFSHTLKTLANNENLPSLQHCRGGKDRTGFALMLLEGILGVPNELLVYDYMLTNRARAKKNVSYYNRFLEETGNEKIAQYLFALFATKPEFIQASMEKILSVYGSFENYAVTVLQLTEEEISNLKQSFLDVQEE